MKIKSPKDVETEEEIKKEIKDDKKENKLIKKKTMGVTKLELKTVDDIDKNRVDARMLFKNLSDLKSMEDYHEYLSDEQEKMIRERTWIRIGLMKKAADMGITASQTEIRSSIQAARFSWSPVISCSEKKSNVNRGLI